MADEMDLLPQDDDNRKTQRLKHRIAKTFLGHASGQGVEIALGILLRIAGADGKDGRPEYEPRTRKGAASDYIRFALQAAKLNDSLLRSILTDGPEMPAEGTPEDAIGVIRIREVEAIIGDDEALRQSILAVRRIHAGRDAARAPGGVRGKAIPGQVDPRTAP
jgi:hypothetical protein